MLNQNGLLPFSVFLGWGSLLLTGAPLKSFEPMERGLAELASNF